MRILLENSCVLQQSPKLDTSPRNGELHPRWAGDIGRAAGFTWAEDNKEPLPFNRGTDTRHPYFASMSPSLSPGQTRHIPITKVRAGGQSQQGQHCVRTICFERVDTPGASSIACKRNPLPVWREDREQLTAVR